MKININPKLLLVALDYTFGATEPLMYLTALVRPMPSSSMRELLSNLVFEDCRSCGDLVGFGGFNSVFKHDACDNFGEVVKAA